MPDYEMCYNDGCPLKRGCLRSEASGTKPSQQQSYVYFQPGFVGLSDHEPNHPGWYCNHQIPAGDDR